MNKSSRTLSVVLALAGLWAGCGLLPGLNVITGSGNVTRVDRPVSGFTAVALDGSGEVTITQGAGESLSIEAEDNLLPLITSVVRDGVLRLDFNRGDWRDVIKPTKPIRFFVTMRDVSALDLAGSGTIQAGALESPNLAVNVRGSGDVSLDEFRGDSLKATLDGSGNITAAGQSQRLEVVLTGSGKVDAGSLESQTASVSVGGRAM